MSRTWKTMTAWLMIFTMLFSGLPANVSLAGSTITLEFDESTPDAQGVAPVAEEEPDTDGGEYGKAYLGVMVDGAWKRIAAKNISRGGNNGNRYYYIGNFSPASYQGVDQNGLLWSISGYADAAAATTTSSNKTNVLSGYTPSASNVVYLHAKANYTFYTVRFLNWDDTVLDTQIVAENGAAQTPAQTPVKDHCEFTGWSTTFNAITAATDVKAEFGVAKYDVVFQNADGTVLDRQTVEEGEAAVAPAVPTGDEHTTFAGWDTEFTNVTSDLVVTALYVSDPYVLFRSQTGEELARLYVAIGQPVGELPAVPDYAGGTDGRWVYGGAVLTAETVMTEGIVATPEYTPVYFEVKFVDRGQQVGATQSVAYGEAAVLPENYVVGTKIRENDTMLFLGWDQATDNVTAPVTARALYTYESNNVYFYVGSSQIVSVNGVSIADGVTVPYGENVPEASIPQAGRDFDVPEGMTFSGWDVSMESIRTTTVASAQFTMDTHTVTFLDAAGNELQSTTVDYGDTVSAPDGYQVGKPFGTEGIFAGWTAADASYSEADLLHVHQDMTFTATFRNTITVRYIDTVNTALANKVISTQTLTLKQVTLDGKTYMAATASAPTTGYSAGSSKITVDGVEYTFIGFSNDYKDLTEDIDIYALYQTAPEEQTGSHIQLVYFFVRYDGALPYEPTQYDKFLYTKVATGYADVTAWNDPTKTIVNGGGNDSNQMGDWVQGYANVLPRLVNGGPKISGLSDDMFVEWYVIKYAKDSHLHVDGVVRYKNTYKVIYYMLGGSPTIVDTANYAPGAAAPVSDTVPTRTGYTFMGWATEENGSVVYQPGDTIPEMPAHNVYLYAVWVSDSDTTRDVTVTKQWYPSAPDGASVTLTLKRKIASMSGTETVDADFAEDCTVNGNGSYTFKALPIYPDITDKQRYYVYYVEEKDSNQTGYEQLVTGLKITNIKLASFTVVKAWQHPDGTAYADFDRDVSVTLRGVTEFDTVTYQATVNAAQPASFNNVPLTDRYGNRFTFTLTEETDDDYELVSNTFDEATGRYTLINRLKQEWQELSVVKVWDDVDNADGLRPSGLMYQLSYTDSGVVKTVNSSMATAQNNYAYKFTGIPSYGADGQPITDLAVRELTVLSGYTTTITREGNVFTVTNTHKPATVNVAVRKVWEDDENRDGLRPDSVTVTLQYAVDGGTPADVTAESGLLPEGVSGSLVLNAGNGWRGGWMDLLEKQDGKTVAYSVVETPLVGTAYDAPVYTRDADGTLVVTNTHAAEEFGSMTATKRWEDGGYTSQRPGSVTATLMWSVAGGEPAAVTAETGLLPEGVSADAILNSNNRWTATWEHLKANYQGQTVTYSVVETKIGDAVSNADYITTYETAEHAVTIVNTVNLIKLTVRKTVVDETADSANGLAATFAFTVNGSGVNESFTLGNGGTKIIDVRKNASYSITETVNGSVWSTTVDGQAQTAKQVSITADTEVSFVNTRKSLTEGVTVTKAWADDSNVNALRPASVVLLLMADGAEINRAELTADNAAGQADRWATSFTTNAEGIVLPAAKVDGSAMTYTADEATVPDHYDKTVSGLTVTNTLTTMVLEGEKTWVDGDNAANRPATITVYLMHGGERIGEAVTDAEHNWKYSFTDVPVGYAADCTVEEAAVAGYTPTYTPDSLSITNTVEQEYVDVTGTKTWIDGGLIHDNVSELTMTLTRTSVTVTEPEQVAADISWEGNTYTYTDLPKYDAAGYPYVYAVSEAQVDGYRAPVQNGNDFTNGIEQKKTSVTVKKSWADADNQDGLRPRSVTMTLYRDGNATAQTVTLTSTDEWAEKTFADLDVYDLTTGAAYAYTVRETAIVGYTADYSDLTDGAITVTNTHTPAETSVTVRKIWRDGGAERPDIVVTLTGTNGETRTTTADGWVKSGDEWTYTFTGLPANQAGQAVTYTAAEAEVTGYSTYYSQNTLTITNVIHTSVTATKSWRDYTDEALIALYRPESVSVTLSASDGRVIPDAQKTITGSGSATWEGLDTYATNGAKIIYTVTEAAVAGYITTYQPADGSADASGNVAITNTIDNTDVIVTKNWVDTGYNALRPDSFVLALQSGGQTVATQTVTSAAVANTQQITFAVPRLNAAGEAAVYTVIETAMIFGGTRIALNGSGFAGGYTGTWSGLTVTNTLEMTEQDVELTKVWQDNGNAFGTRPATLTVRLDGLTGHETTTTFTADTAGSQTLNYGRQPRYVPGTDTEIDYTGTETLLGTTPLNAQGEAMGYAATYSEDRKTITNALATHTVEVTVNWVDSSNLFGTRPDTVTVVLSNGMSQQVTVNGDASQTASFDVPLYMPGTTTEATYTVQETILSFGRPTGDVAVTAGVGGGYGVTAEGLNVTNTLLRTGVSYTKQWVGDNAAYRPATYTVALGATVDGDTVDMSGWTSEITLTQEKRDLSGSWTGLPQYNFNLSASAISYTVAETHIGTAALDRNGQALGYQMTQTVAEGVTAITNTMLGLTFKVTKVWLDDGETVRPAITMQLKANGENYGNAVHLNADNTYTWTNLPGYDQNGNAVTYTVAEVWPANTNGYEAFGEISYGADNTATVTNRLYVDVTGSKTWRVEGNDTLPDTMLVLSQTVNGVTTQVDMSPTWTKTNATYWTYAYRHLPKADAEGNAITYTVTENGEAMVGYEQIAAQDGSFTNTQLIDVTGRKIWRDGGNAEGQRPDEVTLQLYKNDETEPLNVTPTWLNDGATEDSWSYVFADLPYSDENGVITYRVAEVLPAAGAGYAYHQSQSGNDITNTLYGTVVVTKVWADNGDNDGLRSGAAAQVSIQLKRGDDVQASTPLTTESETITYDFADVPLYDAATGTKIVYTAGESRLAQDSGYIATVNGRTVTNTHVPLTDMALTFTKVWDDEQNNDRARPASITVTLMSQTADETSATAEGRAVTVTGGETEDTWTTQWTGLPRFRNGKAITYTVVEGTVRGYTPSEVVYDRTVLPQTASITNSRDSELVTVGGTKTWHATGEHPDSSTLVLTLKRSYGAVSLEDVPEADYTFAWTGDTYLFSGLKRYIAGETVTYTVTETVPEGYEVAYTAARTDRSGNTTINLTNTELTGVVAYKVWHDSLTSADRADLTLTLYRRVGEGASEVVEQAPRVNKRDNSTWVYEWSDLPTMEGNTPITYTVDELTVPAGYAKTVSGLTVHNVALMDVSGTKHWVDDNDRDVLRPESITVHLNASNGAAYDDVTTNAEADWQYGWTSLPAYDANNSYAAITYTVTEVGTISGYIVTGGTAAEGYDLTNTHEADTIDVTVTKAWEDNNNQDGKRPESIIVSLYEDGSDEPIDSKTMTKDTLGNWVPVVFEKLPVNHPKAEGATDAAPVTYRVAETAVEDYTTTYQPATAEITGQSGTVAITNVHTPLTKQVTVSKDWTSIPALESLQPTTVTVQLYKNSGLVLGAEKTLTAPDWSASWTELPVYENGQLIAYTVEETAIDGIPVANSGYSTQKDETVDPGEADVAVTLTNTLRSTSYSVRKEWIGTALQSIEVTLMNGTSTVDTRTLTADTTGVIAYTWENLPTIIGGKTASYHVVETAIPGYTTSYQTGTDGVRIITNTEVNDFTVEKVWVAGNEPHADSITVTLVGTADSYRAEYPITVKATDNWRGTFHDIPVMTVDGQTISYDISESFTGMEAFHIETSRNGYAFTLTNTLMTSVTGTKIWVDGADVQQLRPDTLTVTLRQNGQAISADLMGNAIATEWTRPNQDSGTWTNVYANLPKYDSAGNAYAYTLLETVPEGYTCVGNGTAMTLTNTLQTVLTGTKTWVDGSNALNLRPADLTLSVWIGTQRIPDATFAVQWDKTAANEWQYTITGLPYGTADGAITYTVQESLTQPESDAYAYMKTADDGRNFTNTLTYKALEGTKTWVDGGVIARPDSITVQLYADESLRQNATATDWVKTGDTWHFAFADQPVYGANGQRIGYTVRETQVGTLNVTRGTETATASFEHENDTYRYLVSESGMDITNTLQRDVNGVKVWSDLNNFFGLRPTATGDVSFTLAQNGAAGTARKDSTNANRWLVSFGFQNVVSAGGLVTYTMQESALPQYDATLEGMTITNALKLTSLDGTKTWVDGGRTQTARPSISLTVNANGTPMTVQPAAADITWTNTSTDVRHYAIANLPAVDAAGNAITYTVTETQGALTGDSYTVSTTDNVNLTNTIDQKYINIAGTKSWLDPQGTTHQDVVIDLIRDGDTANPVATFTIPGGEGSYRFDNVPVYAVGEGTANDGHTYVYTVQERAYAGYTPTYTENRTNGWDIRNIIDQVPKDVTVTKIWDDDSNRDGKRQPVTLELLRNGLSFAQGSIATSTTITGDMNTESYTFTGLDTYFIDAASNTCYVYQYIVAETTDLIPVGYEAPVYSEDHLTVTNSYTPETVQVTVRKLWSDDTNRDGLRTALASLSFLVSNDGDAAEQTLTIGRPTGATTNDWGTAQTVALPKYWNAGTLIHYTVTEQNVPEGYVDSYAEAGDQYNVNVTNTHVPATTVVTGTKTWYDGGLTHNNATELRLTLTANDGTTTQTLANTPVWNGSTYSYTDLPVYKIGMEGVALTYDVKEADVPGYVGAQNGNDLINMQLADVTITLNWVDGDQFYRPTTALLLELRANGTVVDSVTVANPTTTGVSWNYTFADKPKYDQNGNLIVYTVNQPVTPGNGRYDAEQSGLVVTNTAYVTVTFVDYDGRVIKTDRILMGDSTTAPGNPRRAGYRFTYWNGGTWVTVNRDQTIRANYIALFDLIEDPNIPLAGGTVQNVGDCFD